MESEIYSIIIKYYIPFKFICIVLFTVQIVAKQIYRKLKFLHYIVTAYQWSQVDVQLAEMYGKNQAVNVM